MVKKSETYFVESFYKFPTDSSAYFRDVDIAYFHLDLRNMNLPVDLLTDKGALIQKAFTEMQALEAGALANPDEGRKVGHYWLRNPTLAKEESVGRDIEQNWENIVSFTRQIHEGYTAEQGGPFRNLLLIGIGGSALGPQLLASALGKSTDPMQIFFFDNTDPDGMRQTLEEIQHTEAGLEGTLVLVVSKSGGTKETRNGQREVEFAFAEQGLRFADRAIAITMPGSELDRRAIQESWLARFPIWDWVGGRTSLLSSVGLVPAALLGINIFALLSGTNDMDFWTRDPDLARNPAMMLALSWLHMSQQGRREMVVLPYKDRLELFSRYLQQLVMESLGKEKDLQGRIVHEGIVVYGNKGSTDQHAYIQQLRDGFDRFFVSFIEVPLDETGRASAKPRYVEDNFTSGDYLLGFLLGTKRALHEKGRPSFQITIPTVSAYTLGMLVALYERAVGFYAFLVGINAYDQPGVEAGKKAANAILQLQRKLEERLSSQPRGVEELCNSCNAVGEEDSAFQILEHLAINRRIGRETTQSENPRRAKYFLLANG